MPHCYFLCIAAGSSVDQHSNNVTLFNLVEQINVPPHNPPPPEGLVPLEIHAYFQVAQSELNQPFDLRFTLVATDSGLETFSSAFSHKSVTQRYRSRTLGVPYPPVSGVYELRVDWRPTNTDDWTRQRVGWPLTIVETDPTPPTRH